MRRLLIPLAGLALAGCQTNQFDNLATGPSLSPVGYGVSSPAAPIPVAFPPEPRRSFASTWDQSSQSLYRSIRASRVGDVLTVSIAIDDQAQFDNSTGRSRNSARKGGFDVSFGAEGFGGLGTSGSTTGDLTLNSDTEAKGKGSIDRSEKLRLSIAAIVTDVMPNGNLMIRGSQEVLVNYEVRVLTIAGMVNPLDISAGNQIAYDKIAEARISYGGRGRLMDVQQPAWGQRIADVAAPF
ncbi:flagellar basal body L-ring protein FlgH [Prosthecomicrobium pneumaticum]|uniref:Flagellar L-ring protein n=1 Tax=Prosthecomicrobium pneumaticum TaxID=81895 RepID=A0A7W9FKP4_9HYPH|nr:flagellar basal body L-ring protein FlgH [Prosthecomicrobium pneumaticum]MBB5751019.1 flagellar L-ring protein precursor FlgH [Prosthecomicrobium pneumaticum]